MDPTPWTAHVELSATLPVEFAVHVTRLVSATTMLRIPGIASLLLLGVGVSQATQAPDDSAPMEVVLVRGDQPGPALWKVSSGDHVLWILGTASPLPCGAGMKRLANAWALGDIATLRELAPVHEISSSMGRQNPEGFACVAAAAGSAQRARDIAEVHTNAWLEASDRALRDNESTMAVVPLVELLATDGYLAGLKARGYEIEEPR